MTLLTVAILILAVYRATRLVTRDDFPPVQRFRNRILAAHPTEAETFYGSEVADPTAHITTIETAPSFIRRRTRLVQVATDSEPYGKDDDGTLTVGADGHPIWSPTEPDPWGTLVTCIWCASFWIALAATLTVWAGTRYPLPAVVWLAVPFALSATTALADRHIDP